jgi:hypothetical protein
MIASATVHRLIGKYKGAKIRAKSTLFVPVRIGYYLGWTSPLQRMKWRTTFQ